MAGTRLYIISSFIIPLILYVIVVCIGDGLLGHSVYSDRFQWKQRFYRTIWIRGIHPILSNVLMHNHEKANETSLPTLNSSSAVPPPTVIFITDHQHKLFWKEHIQNVSTSQSSLFSEKDFSNNNVVLYIPTQETYFAHHSDERGNSIPIGNNMCTQKSSYIAIGEGSFFSIINSDHINKRGMGSFIQSTLNTIYCRYNLNCLNLPESYDIHELESFLVSDHRNMKTITNDITKTNDTTIQYSNDIILSFFIRMYFHRTFYIWYNALRKQSTLIYNELLLHPPKQYSQYHYRPSTILQDRLKYKMMIDLLASPSISSIVYSSHFLEAWEYLQQIDMMAQLVVNNIQQSQAQSDNKHDIDLDIVIHDFPLEQYLAIFGPLLFPLIVPLLMALIREIARYRKLIHTKKSKQNLSK
jgi:hypothetical protein